MTAFIEAYVGTLALIVVMAVITPVLAVALLMGLLKLNAILHRRRWERG